MPINCNTLIFSGSPETDSSNASVAIITSVSVLFLLFIAAVLFLFKKKSASSRVPERTCEDVNPVYGDYSYPDPTAEVEDSYITIVTIDCI